MSKVNVVIVAWVSCMLAVEVVGMACRVGIGGTWSCCCRHAEVAFVVVVVIVTDVSRLHHHHAKVVLSKFVDDLSCLPHHRRHAAGSLGFVNDACGIGQAAGDMVG